MDGDEDVNETDRLNWRFISRNKGTADAADYLKCCDFYNSHVCRGLDLCPEVVAGSHVHTGARAHSFFGVSVNLLVWLWIFLIVTLCMHDYDCVWVICVVMCCLCESI